MSKYQIIQSVLLSSALLACSGGDNRENPDMLGPDGGIEQPDASAPMPVSVQVYKRADETAELYYHHADGTYAGTADVSSEGVGVIESIESGAQVSVVLVGTGRVTIRTFSDVEPGDSLVLGEPTKETSTKTVVFPPSPPASATKVSAAIGCGGKRVNSDLSEVEIEVPTECLGGANTSGRVSAHDSNNRILAYQIKTDMATSEVDVVDYSEDEWNYDLTQVSATVTNASIDGDVYAGLYAYRDETILGGEERGNQVQAGQDMITSLRVVSEQANRIRFVGYFSGVDSYQYVESISDVVPQPGEDNNVELDLKDALDYFDVTGTAGPTPNVLTSLSERPSCVDGGEADYAIFIARASSGDTFHRWVVYTDGAQTSLQFPDFGPHTNRLWPAEEIGSATLEAMYNASNMYDYEDLRQERTSDYRQHAKAVGETTCSSENQGSGI